LRLLDADGDLAGAWAELWEELHQQDDVGDASFAAVPVIARLVTSGRIADWNAYSLAAMIEDARLRKADFDVPSWLSVEYATAWRQLFLAGLAALDGAVDEPLISSIMSVLALFTRQPMLARVSRPADLILRAFCMKREQ
jgi:hypothetical protein